MFKNKTQIHPETVRIIFLDIDGVLNTKADWRKPYTLNSECIREFLRFVKNNPADIVLTSSWRTGFLSTGNPNNAEPIRQLEQIFATRNIRIIGKTRALGKRRATEIMRYLYEHPQIAEYIILDDDLDEFDKELAGIYLTDATVGFRYERKIKYRKVERSKK